MTIEVRLVITCMAIVVLMSFHTAALLVRLDDILDAIKKLDKEEPK